MEGALGDHLLQLAQIKITPKLEHVVQSLMQLSFEHLQGGNSTTFLGNFSQNFYHIFKWDMIVIFSAGTCYHPTCSKVPLSILFLNSYPPNNLFCCLKLSVFNFCNIHNVLSYYMPLPNHTATQTASVVHLIMMRPLFIALNTTTTYIHMSKVIYRISLV